MDNNAEKLKDLLDKVRVDLAEEVEKNEERQRIAMEKRQARLAARMAIEPTRMDMSVMVDLMTRVMEKDVDVRVLISSLFAVVPGAQETDLSKDGNMELKKFYFHLANYISKLELEALKLRKYRQNAKASAKSLQAALQEGERRTINKILSGSQPLSITASDSLKSVELYNKTVGQ